MQTLSGAKAFFEHDSPVGVGLPGPKPIDLVGEADQIASDYAGYPEIIAAQLAELALRQAQAQQSGVVALRSMVDRVA